MAHTQGTIALMIVANRSPTKKTIQISIKYQCARADAANVALLIASEKEHSLFVQPTLCNATHNGPD